MEVQPGLTFLVGDGAAAQLHALHDPPRTVLLPAPPGDEWSPRDVVTAAVGAPHLVGREYAAMSSGERQRARLARVLEQDGVLLLEEPFGYLDVPGARAVLAALGDRTAVVVSEGDPRWLEEADRVVAVDG